MAIQTYASLISAVGEWLMRNNDPDLIARFDDFLALHEERMYYGGIEIPGVVPQTPKLRLREMEITDAAFALTSGRVAKPTGFLELIMATANATNTPMQVVSESVIAAYGARSIGSTRLIAISGTDFVLKDTPGDGATATLRYFKKLVTPANGSDTNWIMTNAPGIYLNGCLTQAAIYAGDNDAAKLYGTLYATSIGSLSQRYAGELEYASNVRMRLRDRTP